MEIALESHLLASHNKLLITFLQPKASVLTLLSRPETFFPEVGNRIPSREAAVSPLECVVRVCCCGQRLQGLD